MAINLGLWRGRSPGEGLFPFITAAGMIAFSVARHGDRAARGRATRRDGAPERRARSLRMGFYVAVLLFYALTLQSLGFIVATIVSVAAILRFAERYSWLATLAIAIGAAAACHVLFEPVARRDPPHRHAVGTVHRLMDLWQAIILGFSTALTWSNLAYCFIGVFVGTAVGVLPGLGPVATISLLLPFSFTMDIASALILMAGVFYGAQYGGSITAILVRIPGEASTVVTCLDGYAMARQGRAGAALGIAAFGSFIAGVLVTIALFLVGPALANVALAFGPAEYTALVLLGLLLVTQLSSGSQISALLMVATGLLLSTVGKDPIYGTERFTFGVFTLFDGLEHRAAGDGHLRRRRTAGDGGGRRRESRRRSRSRAGSPNCCPRAPTGASASCRSCAAPASVSSSACCPAAARRCRRSPPMCWSGGSRKTPSASATARSRAWRGRNPPTTRRRNPRSCRCCRSASRPMP